MAHTQASQHPRATLRMCMKYCAYRVEESNYQYNAIVTCVSEIPAIHT